jgi:hypothetical protein
LEVTGQRRLADLIAVVDAVGRADDPHTVYDIIERDASDSLMGVSGARRAESRVCGVLFVVVFASGKRLPKLLPCAGVPTNRTMKANEPTMQTAVGIGVSLDGKLPSSPIGPEGERNEFVDRPRTHLGV